MMGTKGWPVGCPETGFLRLGEAKMLTVLGFLIFAGAFAVAAYAMAVTVAPNLSRIGDALAGRAPQFAPLGALVLAERRIAVRRWASGPAAPARWREAA